MMPYGGEDVSGAADNVFQQAELLEQILDRDNMRKAWKRANRRFRELLKLNVSVRQIKMIVSSRKAYWKLSRTLSTNMGMRRRQGYGGTRG